jgi:ketosteroid isomerase-like protein
MTAEIFAIELPFHPSAGYDSAIAMRDRGLKILLLLPLVLGLSCGLCGEESSDEEQIRGIIKKAVELAEQKDIGGIMEVVTEDFMVMPRKMDRRQTKGMLLYVFQRYKDLSIIYPRPSVAVEPGAPSGLASMVFLMLRGSDTRPDVEGLSDDLDQWVRKVGDYTRLYRLKLTFYKEDDDWLVQRAHLERFKGTGFGQ